MSGEVLHNAAGEMTVDARPVEEDVRAALEAGEIDKTRYESYVTLYNEAKEVKEWQM